MVIWRDAMTETTTPEVFRSYEELEREFLPRSTRERRASPERDAEIVGAALAGESLEAIRRVLQRAVSHSAATAPR
jgi:hypothetical protein